MAGDRPSRAGRQAPDQAAARLTPMLAQYLEIKAQHPGALLLFRMGDFFETFFEDAQTLARVAGVTLTSRDSKSDNPIPLAGVPHHALDTYLIRLLNAGLTVAICEQTEDPAQAKGLVKREVVEVISPGTATTPELLDGASGRFCLAWRPTGGGKGELGPGAPASGWALLDATTGEFRCGLERATLASLCQRHPVREVIVGEDTDPERLHIWRAALPGVVINPVNTAWFHPAFARRTLLDHFQVATLTPYGVEEAAREPAATAAGAVLRYLSALTLKRPAQVTSLQFNAPGDRLVLDEETLRNLEVFRTFRGERGPGTLVHHIDGTVTPMGRRLLEQRLAEALTDLDELNGWHAGVASALEARAWRADLRAGLRRLGDMERHAARAAAGRLGPAGLRQVGTALGALVGLKDLALRDGPPDHAVARWLGGVGEFGPLGAAITATIAEDAPATTRKPGFIAAGADPELDSCRAVAADSRSFLAGLQAHERETSGISSLKIGYNRVFGYYFEVTNKHLDKVPGHYQQRQTLVNAGRFVTDELKEAERTILEAEETAERLETELFQGLVRQVAELLPALRTAAALVAQADLMLGFAETAERHRYCRPACDDSLELRITAGRHPVVEQLLGSDFIANNTALDGEGHQIVLLTGPNMGGKSTYLRQVALITLMAQAGSFVPADGARIGITDRIFTRVGASDNLARGESTFYVEMSETAHILHQMTRRSLVILDEIGRGTATYDGLSLAWAITEHLSAPDGPRPRAIFATHYHELTDLERDLPGLVNFRLDVKEWEGRIVFMHAVVPGRSDKSYGIHVARLAGLPEGVLRRAQDLLATLTAGDERDHDARRPGGASLAADGPGGPGGPSGRQGRGAAIQATLFHEPERDALKALRDLDLERISPVDAFMWLARLKNSLADL
ncbi:MAG: DNA mismatch repair protein MutS [bacterium]|nr:DNA mismatch repair protein MutS [bacterium]